MVTDAPPDFAGRTKLPVKVAPACSTIVSPGCALSIAACRSSPTLTVTTDPLDDGEAGAGADGGTDEGADGATAAVVTLIVSTLRPAVSKSSVICCGPAPSVTGTFTV